MRIMLQFLTSILLQMAFVIASQAAEHPNILLIVSDDQGYNDQGLLGNGIITPTLDRLAKEGTLRSARCWRYSKKKKILDNTIVIFFSDNGGSGGADNTPLRGHKSQTWEGGIRVPCLIRWPGGDVPVGSVNDEFLTSLERFPSFASATGAKLPENVPLDGDDWWSTVKGETKSPRLEMFWKRKDFVGARVGNWKWVDMGGGSGGLFDLDADIGEKNDLSAERPEVLKRVKNRYANWLREMEAAEPRGPFRDF